MHVAILSYGPSRVTLNAARRARRFSDTGQTVFVVPATEMGARSLDLPGVEMVAAYGGEGLRWVARQIGDDPLLVIHDDVTASAVAIERLVDCWEEQGGAVVAYSNDLETDHFVGSLPSGEKSDERVAELMASARSQPIDSFRPSCLVAGGESLATVIHTGVVDPRVRIRDSGIRVTVASAVVAHDGSCLDRLLPPQGPEGRALLVAAMIVRDEESDIEGCLNSLRGLVDRVEICDTGSTDRTVEIARAWGAEVHQIEWRDDFGWARTQVLEYCRDSAFSLVIDADERVRSEDPERFRRFLVTYRREYPALRVVVNNRSGSDQDIITSSIRSVRILPGVTGAYAGAIHEIPVSLDHPDDPIDAVNAGLIEIDHFGYAAAIVAEKDKRRRNLDIARVQYERRRNFKTTIEYARSLRLAEADSAQSAELFEEAMSDMEVADEAARAYVMGTVALDRLRCGRTDDAYELAREALDVVPADPIAALAFARSARVLDRADDLCEVSEWRRSVPSRRPLYEIADNERSFTSHIVWAYARRGDVDRAYETALGLLQDAPGSFDHWAPLVTGVMALPADGAGLLVPLMLLDPDGRFLPAVTTTQPPEATAEICLRYLEAGGMVDDTAVTGLMAAAISGHVDLARRLAPYLEGLPADLVDRVAGRLRARGEGDLAELLPVGIPA